MKAIFTITSFLACLTFMYSQNNRCQNIYIYDFIDNNKEITDYTEDLTNSVEEAIVSLNGCKVVQRRKEGTLKAHFDNENNLMNRDSNFIKSLSKIGADLVVFGFLKILSKKEFELRLRIENINTTQIISVKSMDFLITDLIDNSKKKSLINQLVLELIGN